MTAGIGLRRVAKVCALATAGLLAGAGGATASTVETDGSQLRIQGENDTDAITVSSDGTTLTITDTGVGGAVDIDADCTQVNPTTVTCQIKPGTPAEVRSFSVNFMNGVDSFTNQNFAAENGTIYAAGSTGAKTMAGGPGSQFLFGGIEGDMISGGPGEDTLFDGSQVDPAGTGGNDLLDGGEGVDETQYQRQSEAPVSITLDGAANDGQAGESDNVIVENVTTGNGPDVIVGDGAANLLAGFGGDDQISGLGGNDELFGELGGSGIAVLARGIALPAGNDSLNGGAGRDSYDCGRGFDLALHDPSDEIDSNCERIGAEVAGDSAAVSGKKKNKLKVEVVCPDSEVSACAGKLKLTSANKKIGKGKFAVPAGKSESSKAKLSKKGSKALKKAGGSLLVTVEATTNEPGGVTTNDGRILIHD